MAEPAATARDLEHLKLLSIFHYVVTCLTILITGVFLIQVAFAILIYAGAFELDERRWMGRVEAGRVAVIGGAFMAAGWILAGMVFWAGRCIARRRRYFFCRVVGVLVCLLFPFGTVLGVFTFLVLKRPHVKALFDGPGTP